MVRWLEIVGLVLLSSTALISTPVPALRAATSANLDILPGERDGEGLDPVDISRLRPVAAAGRGESKQVPVGNPLWSIPLSALTATRERPIFSASRRPPQRAVVAPSVEQVEAPPAPQKAAEPPPLALIGAVVGDRDAIAIFLNRTDQKVVRLRQGETLAGWVLSSVQPREVTLSKADRAEVLALQRAGTAAGAPRAAEVPGLVAPTGVDVSYAPFVPRSTPKNGESDGL